MTYQELLLECDGLADHIRKKLWGLENHECINLTLYCTDIGDKGANIVAIGLRNNSKIRHLNLTGNGIGTTGCVSIATLLGKPNCNIQKLILSENDIGDQGAITLANGLTNNIKLQELNLSCNSIGNVGCESIATLLGDSNCNLLRLLLYGNEINTEGAITLANGLANNSTLQELVIYGNPIVTSYFDLNIVEGVFSKLLCNKSSVSSIYSSNHTLKELEIHEHDDLTCSQLKYLLKLNENENKRNVAIKKILKYHPNIDMTQLFEFGTEDGSLKALPYVIDWFENIWIILSWKRANNLNTSQQELSAIYQFVQAMPSLFIQPSAPTLPHRNTRDQLDADMNVLNIDAPRQQIEKLEKKIAMKDAKISSMTTKDKEKLDDELIANSSLERNTKEQRSSRWRVILRRRMRLSWPRSKRI